MAGRQTIKKTRIPDPTSIPEIKVGVVESSQNPEPQMETLRAARSLLLAEYGPCAANHPELLIATARRLQSDANQAS